MTMPHEPAPVPTSLTLRSRSRCLDVEYADGLRVSLSAEFLRVHSPSAEVTGHHSGEGLLVSGKESVAIERIEPIGRYAVRIVFDDGHDSGLYSWRVLHDLSRNRDAKWQRYIERLREAGIARVQGQ